MGIIRWIIDLITGRRHNLRYYVGFKKTGNKEVYVLGNHVDIIEEQTATKTVLYSGGATVTVDVPIDDCVLALETAVKQYIG